MSSDKKTSSCPKKVHIETWGCQMNVADSEKLLSLLEDINYFRTDQAEDADLIVLNTCNIREKARHKVLSRLGRIKELKLVNPDMIVAVAGCVAQAEGEQLLKTAPIIDILISPSKATDLPGLVKDVISSKRQKTSLGFDVPEETPTPQTKASPTLTGKNEISRFVNIIHGCDNFCTFCIVPHTRGRERSKSSKIILEEARLLAESGTKEIFLLGQNVNSYGLDFLKNGTIPPSENGPFVDLLNEVASIKGLERVRFTTSNPHDLTKAAAELFGTNPKFGKYIHLPLQSGSNRILRKMNRKIVMDDYHRCVDWLRETTPDIAISTDLIVGFPGETEEDFQDTLSVVEKVKFSFIYSFKYSPRTGTPASKFDDQIDEKTKDVRLARLNKIQDRVTIDYNESEIGKTREVLFLYESKKAKGNYYGRTEHFRSVRIEAGRSPIGKCLPVKITGGNKTALEGILS